VLGTTSFVLISILSDKWNKLRCGFLAFAGLQTRAESGVSKIESVRDGSQFLQTLVANGFSRVIIFFYSV